MVGNREMNMTMIRSLILTGALASMTLASGCSNPDAEGRFNSYGERTEDRRGTPDTGMDMGTPDGSRVDFSGTYFMAVEVAGVGVGRPLYIRNDVTVDLEANTISMTLQPLKTDIDINTSEARPDARTPVGDPSTVEGIVFNEDGTFTADLGDVIVAGEANPISGSRIESTMVLQGIVASTEVFCGTVTGMATLPSPWILRALPLGL